MSGGSKMSASIFQSSSDNSPISESAHKTTGLRRQGSFTPLHKFVDAKSRINDIFQNIEKYIVETVKFLKDVSARCDVVTPSAISEVELFCESIKTIKSVLARDKMKVVFFGRTSNGKSTVVNAMLHSKVLPSGIGHTTRCFLQVEGSTTGEKYILTEGSDEQKSLLSIDNLSNALCSKEMGEDALVKVMWPKVDSRLLKNEVVLLDSPGVDVSPQFDSWIDKHCLDADVFVLVSNAESTLTQTEKNFFHRVNAKLSKPNLFILNNRWDASAAEPEYTEQVREQHMKQFLRFLVDELNVCSADEASHRVFFVSAREVLQHRLKNKGVAASPMAFFAEGFQTRLMEFEDFERQFEICISQSAIETKFESHVEKGKRIASSVHEVIDDLHTTLTKQREVISKKYDDQLKGLRASQSNCVQFFFQSKEMNQQLSYEVKVQVLQEFTEEIKRLETIIDSFHKQFSDDVAYLDGYKKELMHHVDGILTNELHVRLTGGLLEKIIAREREMITGASSLLPPIYSNKCVSLLQFRTPFRFSFAIHFPSLLDDFREDLEFRFSLGPTQLVRWFMQFRGNKSQLFGNNSMIPRPMTNASPETELGAGDFNAGGDGLMPSIIYSSATYIANGGVGLMLIGGLVYRTVGFRVIATIASLYGILYVYERVSWNARTKERVFKKQIRKHLSTKLNQVSHGVTMSCENQVSREVQEVLSQLQGLSNEALQEMKVDVDKLQKEIHESDQIAKQFWQCKGKATALITELVDFLLEHLHKDNSISS